jgi:hypothetical protein
MKKIQMGENTNLALTPFTGTQKGPYTIVIPNLNPEILKILAHRLLDFLLFDKQDGTIVADVQI